MKTLSALILVAAMTLKQNCIPTRGAAAGGDVAPGTGTFRYHKLNLLPDERSKLMQQVHRYTDK